MTGRAPTPAVTPASAVAINDVVTQERAVWTTAEINDLPDSSFAYIEPGGKKDSEGKTTPRNLRHLPFKDADGKIDLPHLRNALSRLPQSALSDEGKAHAQKVLDAAAKEAGVGEENKDDKKKDEGERAADTAATPGAELAGTLYAPFVRRDDGKWEVEGVLTSEDIDSYGTIFDYDSAKRAVADWAGNVREQHDIHKAVGRRVEYECDDANRQVRLRVRVSKGAPDTWAKVLDGTLTGFSIGAYNANKTTRAVNGRSVPVYKDYQYGEVSLVDAPSNPAAASSGLTICRVAGLTAPEGAETQWNDTVLERFEASASESAEAPTPESAPVATETPADVVITPEQRTAAADAPSTPAAFTEALAALESVVGPMSEEQRSQIANAAALMRGMAGAPAAEAEPESAPVTETPAPAVTPAPEQTRASIDLASGAAFQGNDLANDPDAPKPDAAMLNDTGHAHDAHSHAHATSYGGFHSHSHMHTHQDGTQHEHPHMHNHVHHEHYGDADHSHAHAHVHDHSHEYRAAAPDISVVSEPYPDGRESATTLAPAGDEQRVEQRAASHGAFTGKHAHAHAAFGSQGDDESHEHEHSHDGDADHHHSHEAASEEGERATATPEVAAVVTPDATPAPPDVTPASPAALERAGQRISAATSAALHQAALQILRTCDCPTCQDAIALYDPDDDGDDDLDGPAGGDDPDGDGPMRSREAARLMRLQQVKLTRATRKSVAAEVERQFTPLVQQFRAIAARLTTVNGTSSKDANSAGSSASAQPQLDELRASMEAVRGLVEQIAQQPAPGGPILRAADKMLGMYAPAQALDASAAPAAPGDLSPAQLAAAIRQLQRAGALSDQSSQVNAAAALLQRQMQSSADRR